MNTRVKPNPSSLVAIVRNRGLLSVKGQASVRRICELGHVQMALEVVAGLLLRQGLEAKDVPWPKRNPPREFAMAVEERIKDLVLRYSAEGGVLVSKGYVEPLNLIAEICKQWTHARPNAIPTTIKLDLPKEEELNARLTVCAQKIHALLKEKGKITKGREDYPSEIVLSGAIRIENFCAKTARLVLEAFLNPNQEETPL